METILIVVLLLILVGALPTWPYSRSWGYYPSGMAGLIILVIVIMLLTGRLLAMGRQIRTCSDDTILLACMPPK